MLNGVDRPVDMAGPRESGLTGAAFADVVGAILSPNLRRLASTDGHFAAVEREGEVVRLSRSIDLPLRYFVAKRFHSPFLVVVDRIDRLYDNCRTQKIGCQFDSLDIRQRPLNQASPSLTNI